jgi:hypothetical protein
MLQSVGCCQVEDVLFIAEAFYVGSDMSEPEGLGLPCCQHTLEATSRKTEKQMMAYNLN